MTRDTLERLWRRVIVTTGVFALAIFVLMAVSGHMTGVHDTTFGMVLMIVFILSAAVFTLSGALYVLYAIVMLLMQR